MNAYLEIIIGPMFSGKSSHLISYIRRLKVINKKYMVINSKLDNRYGENVVSSHNKEQELCLCVNELKEILDNSLHKYNESEYIFIEEAHFYKDLFQFVMFSLYKKNKKLIIYGLDGDYKQEPIGDILKLIPHCDEITKLKAYCKKSNDGTEASFTIRISDDKEQIKVGKDDNYLPVCRKYLKH